MSSERIIFTLKDLHKFYGLREVLKGINLSFFEDAKIGVIGPNGAGKSTLLKILAGVDKEIEGEARPIAGLSIGYLSQEPQLNEAKTVAGNLEEAVDALRAIEARYYEVMTLISEAEGAEAEKLSTEYEKLQHEMDFKDIWNIDSRLEQAAGALLLPPMEAEVKVLSGGEKRRIALCMLLLEQPDLLLLDEPTNHLDAETVEWLEHHLANYPGAVILITHDRYFLDNVVNWMLEIERGVGTPYKGNYTAYLIQKQKNLDLKRKSDSKEAKRIKAELEWKAKTPKARTTQSKARLQRLEEMQHRKASELVESVDLRIPPGPRLGDKVIAVSGVSKKYGDKVLFEDLTFEVPPGGILGIVGPNGMGKTTLLRLILEQETPDSGSITIGKTVEIIYLDQSRMILDDTKSVYENITEGNDLIVYDNVTLDARAYVSRFNFKGEDQQKLLGECSGGMRNRVLLARMLKQPANVILLDEPTNDLDLDTLRVLEDAIMEYAGSAIVVSHDRYFLNRVATHILAFEGDANVNFHHGDYESYTEYRKKWRIEQGIGPDSRSSKYRKLLRS